jgi:hypothetical protein
MTPTVAKGVWGWDPLLNYCWIALDDRSQRIAWTIGSIYAWNLISASVALLSTIAVLWRLYAHSRSPFIMSTVISERSQQDIVRRVAVRIIWYPLVLSALMFFKY